MSTNDKIKELKIELPEAKPPVGNYVATKISGKCYMCLDKYLLIQWSTD